MKNMKSKLIGIMLKISAFIVLLILAGIILYVLILGIPQIKLSLFQWKYNSENVSMMPAIINTLFMIVLSLVIAIPLGLGAAIFLTQYKKEGAVVKVIRMTSETLSGIPSIVYGLFGNIFFSTVCGLGYSFCNAWHYFRNNPWNGKSIGGKRSTDLYSRYGNRPCRKPLVSS